MKKMLPQPRRQLLCIKFVPDVLESNKGTSPMQHCQTQELEHFLFHKAQSTRMRRQEPKVWHVTGKKVVRHGSQRDTSQTAGTEPLSKVSTLHLSDSKGVNSLPQSPQDVPRQGTQTTVAGPGSRCWLSQTCNLWRTAAAVSGFKLAQSARSTWEVRRCNVAQKVSPEDSRNATKTKGSRSRGSGCNNATKSHMFERTEPG